MKKGDVVFWHDPDGDVGSGVGKIVKKSGGMLLLAMLSGSEAEVPSHEVTTVNNGDVVGVDLYQNLLFYNAKEHATYTDGSKVEMDSSGEYVLDSEERRRVAAIDNQMSR